MKKMLIIILLILAVNSLVAKPAFVATNHPIQAILKEIAGTTADISNLVPPGASPHTFSPKPSDVSKAQGALALFYVAPELDGWAANLSCKNRIKIMDLIPKSYQYPFEGELSSEEKGSKHNHDKDVIDPHFWTDPLTVKALLPGLTEVLSKLDPVNSKTYRANSNSFSNRLDELNKQIEQKMAGMKGQKIFLFHPSFRYFLRRYGLVYAGSIEPSPGKEPSVKYITDLINKIKKNKAKALFTEPQLPEKPARAIAEAAKLKLFVLDPIGGIVGRESYRDLILYNTEVFLNALK